MIKKRIGYRSTILVHNQLVLELLGLDLEEAVLDPHMVVFKILENDAEDHWCVVVRQSAMSKQFSSQKSAKREKRAFLTYE